MKNCISFCACISLLFLSSCNYFQNKENEDKNLLGAVTVEDYGSCDSISGARVGLQMWLLYESDSATALINATIKEKVVANVLSNIGDSEEERKGVKDLKSAFKLFDENYQSFKKEFPDAPGCWDISQVGDSSMVTAKYLMYTIQNYAFTGGAHPNTFESNYIFDFKDGSEVNRFKFVQDSTALLKLVEEKFRKIEKLAPDADLEAAGYFLQNNTFFLPANFTFSRKGVAIYYNAYEIAPYVRGAISFTIPYDELKGIVNSELLF